MRNVEIVLGSPCTLKSHLDSSGGVKIFPLINTANILWREKN